MKRILYIASRLPAVSATFIDREIRALSESGYDIRTVSRGTPLEGEVSKETLNYYRDCLYLDQVGTLLHVGAQIRVMARKPREWIGSLLLIAREREVRGGRDRLRLLKHFLEAGYLYTRIKDQDIAHIHAHFLNAPTSIALFLSRFLEIPFSFTMHASNIFIDPLMLGTKLRLCKKAVTISEYNRRFLLQKYGEDLATKIHTIHCGIDPEMFPPCHGEKKGSPLVLAVGRLVAMKGFSYLLEACRIARDRGNRFRCFIVGDGEERDLLFKQADDLGIRDDVTFLGSQLQEKVRELLHEASLFVLPATVTDQGRRDGIPVALMEAMAMELPVVSTRIVGIPELIEDKKEGLLVEQRDADELASAMCFMLRNRAAAVEMGRQARLKVIREFNIRNVPAQFYPIFN